MVGGGRPPSMRKIWWMTHTFANRRFSVFSLTGLNKLSNECDLWSLNACTTNRIKYVHRMKWHAERGIWFLSGELICMAGPRGGLSPASWGIDSKSQELWCCLVCSIRPYNMIKAKSQAFIDSLPSTAQPVCIGLYVDSSETFTFLSIALRFCDFFDAPCIINVTSTIKLSGLLRKINVKMLTFYNSV